MPANSTFTELVSTTLRKHMKGIKDNVSERNAVLKWMKDKGNVKLDVGGGFTIVEPLDYAANSTYQRYSDWDILNISQSDVISAAEFAWKQIAIHVVASGREVRINSGDQRLENLVKARIKNAIRTFNNNFSNDLYSAGTATNQIGGLQQLVADTNTNTVGGIDANVWTFWRNTVKDASDDSVTVSATTIEGSMMLPLWLSLDRGPDDHPDLIIFDSVYWAYWETSQVSFKRYASSDSAKGGFLTLKYKSADTVYDSAASGMPASHGYFLNTQYLHLVSHPEADMEVMDKKEPVNQDGSVTPIIWMGNLTISNRKLQGVMKA